MSNRKKYGLVGKDISYSFSRDYFTKKFIELNLKEHSYRNFDIPEIEEFPFLLYQKEDDYQGLNVTIPYKESIMKYLSEIDEVAEKIGAVNTIKITEDNELIGYNTDAYGFEKSLVKLLESHHEKALILGTGGASKAVAYVLEKLNIEYKFVSRSPNADQLSYDYLNETILNESHLIINSTPLGTFPNIELSPDIPYNYLTKKHLLYDLIYNPEETTFLKLGKDQGAMIKNGSEMLKLQAEKSWEIWNASFQ
jgi:shikimate dehydrogenase